jgi:hypothetical protein
MTPTTHKMVLDWARERGILDKSDPLSQLLKTVEELGELARAINKNDVPEQIDAIGDVYVTLILLNELMGGGDFPTVDEVATCNPKWCLAMLTHRVGQLSAVVAGDVVRDHELVLRYAVAVQLTHINLMKVAHSLGHNLQMCLDHAYGVISQRTGRMENGVFVKDQYDEAGVLIRPTVMLE